MTFLQAVRQTEPKAYGAYEEVDLRRPRWTRGFVVIFRRLTCWNGSDVGAGTTTDPDGALELRRSSTSPWRRDQTAGEKPVVDDQLVEEPVQTTNVPGMLAETKQLTGWSWETLANALECSRQAVHGWTLGREIKQENLDRLGRLHATVKFIDCGNAEANRVLLAQDAGGGEACFDLLVQGAFARVRERLGRGKGRPEWTPIVPTHLAEEQHWFERLSVETDGADQDAQFALKGEKRRLAVRRRE